MRALDSGESFEFDEGRESHGLSGLSGNAKFRRALQRRENMKSREKVDYIKRNIENLATIPSKVHGGKKGRNRLTTGAFKR